jgi:hypothetical protein
MSLNLILVALIDEIWFFSILDSLKYHFIRNMKLNFKDTCSIIDLITFNTETFQYEFIERKIPVLRWVIFLNSFDRKLNFKTLTTYYF